MKEIYDWVPWFRKLGKKIADRGEEYLIEKVKKVDWKGKRLVDIYGAKSVDPFSFFYCLAQKKARYQREIVYNSVHNVFDISAPPDTNIDDYYIIPTTTSLVLFHDGKNFDPNLLWRLFRQAVEDVPTIDQDDFKKALKIKEVGVKKLTQTLFLINPEYFLPVDETTFHLSEALSLPALSEIEREIEDGGYEKYKSRLKEFKEAFPGCQLYEINMFLDRQKSGQIKVSDNFFQISTNVDNDGKDHWNDFEKNNWAYTNTNYPGWRDSKRGDIILVRMGKKEGKAIGIVQENNYDESKGLNEDSRIHVLWINKSERDLPRELGRLGAFTTAHSKTLSVFEETESYKPSFHLINSLTGNSIKNKSNLDDQQSGADTVKYPLNQILYGPPGTGKTWNTVNRAVAIIEGKSLDKLDGEDREEMKQRFDTLKEDGQIEMVTFHQNFTYEDFIEGIRPVLADDGNGNIEYELSRGVFREIVERADKNRTQSKQIGDKSWNMDELLQAFAESIQEKLESGETINLSRPDSTSGATIQKIKWSGEGKFNSFQLGGSVTSLGLSRKLIERDYENFYKGNITSKKDIKPTRESTGSHHGLGKYYLPLFEIIKQFHDGEWQPEESVPVEKQNYVLIIDEINRGNIAKIFGELITLIESSKRIEGDDEATVTLPYSQDSFGVPDNLYIIGTMNTADRSTAPLDTALRRRFKFVEMMPDLEHHKISTDIEGVNCQELLAAMNKRIRFLFDREHQIGHTYFMDVDDMESLAATFKNQIIPLLQEYFYDNWEKIDLVLNCNGFVHEIPFESDLFKNSDLIDEERKIYELLPDDDGKWEDPKSYQAIYEKEQGETDEAGRDT